MSLRELGFTAEQEYAYRGLLADPARSAEDLVPGPADRRRAVLAGLVELGVLRSRPTAPCGFAAVDPAVALGQLVERTEDDLLEQQRRVGGTRSEVAALARLHETVLSGTGGLGPLDGTGRDDVERIEGVDRVRDRLAELSFFARRSVWTVQPSPAGAPAAAAAARPLEARGLRRGLDIRILYPRTALDDPLTVARLRARAGSVRFGPAPAQRMILLDEEVAVLAAPPTPGEPGGSGSALVVRQPGLLIALVTLFQTLWDVAAPEFDVAGAGSEADEPLTEADRTTLALLAMGCTDERVARELGVSVRHARRRVARLMEQLQARSRFEAGVAAARRGWV